VRKRYSGNGQGTPDWPQHPVPEAGSVQPHTLIRAHALNGHNSGNISSNTGSGPPFSRYDGIIVETAETGETTGRRYSYNASRPGADECVSNQGRRAQGEGVRFIPSCRFPPSSCCSWRKSRTSKNRIRLRPCSVLCQGAGAGCSHDRCFAQQIRPARPSARRTDAPSSSCVPAVKSEA